MHAIILAGGKGTRLKPYTTLIPKPLVPIGGQYSILEIVIMQLANAGFTRVTLAVNHLAHLIMAYFGDGSKYGIRIEYSLESNDLGTIGPLTLIKDLPEHFLVMNGDILCNLDYKMFYENHLRGNCDVTVSSYKRSVKIDFGVIEANSDNFITKFVEKPTFNYNVSMGVYCLRRTVIEKLKKNNAYGFDDLMHDSLRGRFSSKVQIFDGYWLDIGRPEDYDTANNDFDKLKSKFGIQ